MACPTSSKRSPVEKKTAHPSGEQRGEHLFTLSTTFGIFRTFRALRTIWRSFLPQDALSKRARENSVTTYGTA